MVVSRKEVDEQISKNFEELSRRHRLISKLSRAAVRSILPFHDVKSKDGDLSSIFYQPKLHSMLQLFAHTKSQYEPGLKVFDLFFSFIITFKT